MIVFMIKFLNKQEGDTQDALNSGNKIDIELKELDKKEAKIRAILNNKDGLFNKGLREIFAKLNLVSYIDLPLTISPNYNKYPFGKGLTSEQEKTE